METIPLSIQIMTTIGLTIYILELAYEFNQVLEIWNLLSSIKIIRYALIVSLISNGAFLTWTCITLYRVWFQNNNPQVLISVVNLMAIAFVNLILIKLRKNNL